MFDLIIKKGMAVLPDAVEMVDIAVKNGVIAAMAPTIDERAAREINALGQYVLPGMVDVHMHLSEPGRTEWEGYRTGTQAMAAGGITSFAEMPLNQIPCTTDVPSLEIKLKAAEGNVGSIMRRWEGLFLGISRIWHRSRMQGLRRSRPSLRHAAPVSRVTLKMSPTLSFSVGPAKLRKRMVC